jgi:phosphoribosyl 1,2-cyclic phosphodiesterase
MKHIKQALNFDLSGVVGCLVSHEHADHCKGVYGVISSGINTYALKETHLAMHTIDSHRAKAFETNEGVLLTHQIGSFKVLPFKVKHDVPCVGFLVQHKECGKLLFITDSYYCPFVFKGLNNIICEANYSEEIIKKKYGVGTDKYFLHNRILKSHMSLETCCDMLGANDLTAVNNIVLIHLSDTNSDERIFKSEVEKITGKNVSVASNGMEIEMGVTPF